jgi:hypothetical protein
VVLVELAVLLGLLCRCGSWQLPVWVQQLAACMLSCDSFCIGGLGSGSCLHMRAPDTKGLGLSCCRRCCCCCCCQGPIWASIQWLDELGMRTIEQVRP